MKRTTAPCKLERALITTINMWTRLVLWQLWHRAGMPICKHGKPLIQCDESDP